MNEEKKLGAIADFLSSLTLARVALGLVLAGGCTMIYAMWESRAQWSATLWQSPTVLAVVLVGCLLTALGAFMNSLQRRLDDRTDALYQQLRDQKEDMQRAIERGDEERRDMRLDMAQLVIAEKQCQQRLHELKEELASYAGFRRRTDTAHGDLDA
jgi:TolA-binding protein